MSVQYPRKLLKLCNSYRGLSDHYERKTGEANHDSNKKLRNVLFASIKDMEETEYFQAKYELF